MVQPSLFDVPEQAAPDALSETQQAVRAALSPLAAPPFNDPDSLLYYRLLCAEWLTGGTRGAAYQRLFAIRRADLDTLEWPLSEHFNAEAVLEWFDGAAERDANAGRSPQPETYWPDGYDLPKDRRPPLLG